jgi:hypothetical protein
MGGAYVAAGSGISSVQYNPALLGEGKLVEVSVPNVVLQIQDQGGLIDAIDGLNTFPSPAYASTQDFVDAVAALDGKMVQLEGNYAAGVGLQAFGLGLGVTYTQQVLGAVTPIISNVNIGDPVGILSDNYLMYLGLELDQVIITGAKELGSITVGANLRQINGSAFMNTANIFGGPDIDLDSVTTGADTDVSATSFDVGVVAPLGPGFTVGAVMKDANEPDLADDITMERSVRAGAALDLPFAMVTADYDIIVPEDVNGDENKGWAIGAELDLPILELRLGMSDNGMEGAPTLTHMGIGLGAELFKFDVGAAYADDGDYYAAGVNLSVKF